MSLAEILVDSGIRLRHLTPGSQHHIDCPRCGGGQHRDKGSLSVRIDDDGRGATWTCHRGTCGWTQGAHEPSTNGRRPLFDPPSPPPPNPSPWPDWLTAFWDDRHIGAQTLAHFGVYYVGYRQAMAFPYRHEGKHLGVKYRTREKKINQDPGIGPVLFNADSIDPKQPLIWVEGEPDALAIHESGYPNVVSLKDGAPAKASFKPEAARFAALATHADVLAKVPYHILAGDMDAPGLALRAELSRRLGRHKVRLVTWPDGCKDACDTIRGEDHGKAVRAAVEAAKPYPIEGIIRLKPGRFRELQALKDPPIMMTGAKSTDAILKLPTEGALIVITGIPTHGKTTWTRFLAVYTILHHERRWLIFTAEEDVDRYHRQVAEIIAGKPFREMSGDELDAAQARVDDRLDMIEIDAERNAPTIDSLLDRARMSVLQYGTTDFLIDPWNELEHQRGDMTETDYISRALQKFRAFSREYNCNVWIAAHPAKPNGKREDKLKAPIGYDISGSANWANKCDLGLTVHRPDNGPITEISVWKSRWHRWAALGAKANLDYDQYTSRYLTPIKKQDDPPPNVRNYDDD